MTFNDLHTARRINIRVFTGTANMKILYMMGNFLYAHSSVCETKPVYSPQLWLAPQLDNSFTPVQDLSAVRQMPVLSFTRLLMLTCWTQLSVWGSSIQLLDSLIFLDNLAKSPDQFIYNITNSEGIKILYTGLFCHNGS